MDLDIPLKEYYHCGKKCKIVFMECNSGKIPNYYKCIQCGEERTFEDVWHVETEFPSTPFFSEEEINFIKFCVGGIITLILILIFCI